MPLIYCQDLFPETGLCGSQHDTVGEGIYEVISLPPLSDLPYCFELSAGSPLTFEVQATGPFDIDVCDWSVLDAWTDAGCLPGQLAPVHLGARSIRGWRAIFFAPRAGDYVVLLANPSHLTLDVVVRATAKLMS